MFRILQLISNNINHAQEMYNRAWNSITPCQMNKQADSQINTQIHTETVKYEQTHTYSTVHTQKQPYSPIHNSLHFIFKY